MVGGTTPPQSDSGEISRVLVLNLLWQSKRCSRTAQDISVLTTPSLLSRGSLCVIDEIKKGWASPPGCSHRRIMVDVLGRIDGWWKRSSTEM